MAIPSHSFDIIVVGCGIAGLSAAVSALQNGARVALLERSTREERGGNTRYTEAFLRVKSETEVSDDFVPCLTANAGGHLDPVLMATTAADHEHWPSIVKAMSFADPEVISTFADAVGPTLQWLKSLGVRFDFQPTPFITTSTPRMSPVGGGLALVEALAAQAEGLGATFFYETTARDLIQAEDGAVVGLHAVGRGNVPLEFRGQAVVLGSGGFEGNAEMLSRYLGARSTYTRPVARGGYYNKGECIQAALRIGAAPCGDYGLFHAEPVDPRSGRPEAAIFIFQYGILVNRLGRRFVDEARETVDAMYEAVTRRIYEEPQGIAYTILDAKFDAIPNTHQGLRTDQPPVVADTLAELAAKLDLPAEALEGTVRAYNAACRPGPFKPLEKDGLRTEGLEPPKSNWAQPLDTPPFKSYPIIASNVFTFGGLKVNTRAQVLNADGDVLRGLYAAGEVVGLYYGPYTGSTSVLKGAVFGRLAGQDAAARLKAPTP